MIKRLFALLVMVSLAACASHPAFDDDGYSAWMDSTSQKIQNKSDYKRIPIDTDEQLEHFITLSYKAYKKQISKDEFIRNMSEKYPRHLNSIKWVASQLPK